MANDYLQRLDLERETIEQIVNAVVEVGSRPGRRGRVLLNDVIEVTREDREVVFDVLVALWLSGQLRTTYVPRHRGTGAILGEGVDDEAEIDIRFEAGAYDRAWHRTNIPVSSPKDIKKEIRFWLADSD